MTVSGVFSAIRELQSFLSVPLRPLSSPRHLCLIPLYPMSTLFLFLHCIQPSYSEWLDPLSLSLFEQTPHPLYVSLFPSGITDTTSTHWHPIDLFLLVLYVPPRLKVVTPNLTLFPYTESHRRHTFVYFPSSTRESPFYKSFFSSSHACLETSCCEFFIRLPLVTFSDSSLGVSISVSCP